MVQNNVFLCLKNWNPVFIQFFKPCSVWLLEGLVCFRGWIQRTSHKEGCEKRECAPLYPSSEVYHIHMIKLLCFFVQTAAQELDNSLFNGLTHLRFHAQCCFYEYICISQYPGTALLLPCGIFALVWFCFIFCMYLFLQMSLPAVELLAFLSSLLGGAMQRAWVFVWFLGWGDNADGLNSSHCSMRMGLVSQMLGRSCRRGEMLQQTP